MPTHIVMRTGCLFISCYC